jgi:membrane-bound ClpP family serine protease
MDSKVNQATPINVNVGDEGLAISTLRPMGKGEINGQVLEIRSFGELIEAESKVRVAKVDKRKIFVELIN